jgi:putative ABC transport system permease protein
MLSLTFKNLTRRKLRTIIAVAGVAIAFATLFSLVTFQHGYEHGLRRELDQLGAHILVVPKGCPYDAASLALHGANWPCYLKSAYLKQVAQTPGVAAAAPVLMTAHYGTNQENDVWLGVTPEFLKLKPRWKISGSFPQAAHSVLIGARKAESLHATAGDQVRIKPLSEPVLVAGVLNPTDGPDDDFVFARLEDVQRWFGRPESLTHILVKLSDPSLLEHTVEQLRGCDAGMQMNIVPLAHLFETIRNIVNSTRHLLLGLAAVSLLISMTALANTMIMAVLERTREIGVLRATGASPGQVFCLFAAESLAITCIGAGAGLLAALSGSQLIESWIRSQLLYAPGTSLIRFDFASALICFAATALVGSLAALLPALRAARLSPVAAFRAQSSY